MKREEDLCLKILRFIEKNQTSYEQYLSDDIKIKDYNTDQVIYHLDLLEDMGFVEILNMNAMNNNWRMVKRITSVGHDLLDSIRNG